MQVESVKIRKIEFGKGLPKICVPIVGNTEEEILAQAHNIIMKRPDCIELRIDWFQDVIDIEKVLHILERLRQIIGETVLLFTFRSDKEGGKQAVTCKTYWRLCKEACQSSYIDLIDVEAFMQEELLSEACRVAHENGVYVVASSHDFNKTPNEKEILRRLDFMEKQGADMPKIAVMPQSARDVLVLWSATLKYYEMGGKKPIITMSMNDIGMISRLAGEIFGSVMTFATVEGISAPGQLPIEEVRHILTILHGE